MRALAAHRVPARHLAGRAGSIGQFRPPARQDAFALAAAGGKETFARLADGALRAVLAEAGLSRRDDEAGGNVVSGFAELSVHPDVPDGIRLLHQQGLRLVTLSNGSAAIADRLLTSAGVRGHFDHLLSVEDAGAWKPVPAAYARVCSVAAVQMLLVAVHPWDIHGAHRAGMRTGWLTRRQEPCPGYVAAPDLQALDLASLAAQIIA